MVALSKDTLTEDKFLILHEEQEEEKLRLKRQQAENVEFQKNFETQSVCNLSECKSNNEPLLLFSLSSESTSSASISASNSLLNEQAINSNNQINNNKFSNAQLSLTYDANFQPKHRKILTNEKLRKTQKIWHLTNLDKVSIITRLRNKNIGVCLIFVFEESILIDS